MFKEKHAFILRRNGHLEKINGLIVEITSININKNPSTKVVYYSGGEFTVRIVEDVVFL